MIFFKLDKFCIPDIYKFGNKKKEIMAFFGPTIYFMEQNFIYERFTFLEASEQFIYLNHLRCLQNCLYILVQMFNLMYVFLHFQKYENLIKLREFNVFKINLINLGHFKLIQIKTGLATEGIRVFGHLVENLSLLSNAL